MYYVYKHYDIYDNIIYIGITNDIKRRIIEHISDEKGHTPIEHKRNIYSIEFATVMNKKEAEFYETYYINSYKPKYNISKNSSNEYITIQLPELNWYKVKLDK